MPAENDLDTQIGQWRAYLTGLQAFLPSDVDELEERLRSQIAALMETGLSADEAFMVAVKRLGSLDPSSREFVREHSDRLWKQLVLTPTPGDRPDSARAELLVAVGLAVAAAVAVKLPELFGLGLTDVEAEGFYLRNLSFFVLPFLAGFFAWKRRMGLTSLYRLAPPFVAAAVFANVFPYAHHGFTQVLSGIHLPIALWLVVGLAYVGGRWRSHGRRMDFVRFSGELFIYYVLIALGGGVLIMFTLAMFSFIGFDLEWLAQSWLLPCGAMGAVIVGAWLVEAKQGVIENMAPVLTRVFSPLFALLLLAFLVTMVATGSGIDFEREVLIGFDLLLILVLGLVLYAVSARDPVAPPDLFDALQLVLVISALVVDAVALTAIAGRITEFGFSPNRVAALGENLILLVNLAWSAWLYFRFLRRRVTFAALERWQTAYLPVYGVWATVVVAVFPPVFGYQ